MMHPDRMRRIDFWIGVPLCFLSTLASRLLAAFSRKRSSGSEPANVLFIELAEMGSVVLAAPAVARLRAFYPDCNVFFLIFEQIHHSVKVLRLAPDAHVLTIDATSLFTVARDTLKFMRTARRLRIDTTVNLEAFARFSTLLAWLSGARRRVGFHRFSTEGLYTGRLLTHEVQYNPHFHITQLFLTLVLALREPDGHVPRGKLPIGEELRLPAFTADPDVLSSARNLLRREYPAFDDRTSLVLVNPNASKLISLRRWPIEHYVELVARLVRRPDIVVGITGVASERDDARVIVDAVRSDRVLDLTGKTTLDELIALYTMAELLITNDSGPAHFAALTDVDIIVFFGPETPALYRPLTPRCTVMHLPFACSPCVSAHNHRVSPCNDNLCLKSIAPETVYARAAEILDGRRAGAP